MYTQKINLMPHKDNEDLSGGNFRRYGIIFSLAIIIAVLVIAALYFQKNNLTMEDKGLDASISYLDLEIKRNTDSGIDDFKKRAKVLSQLLNDHLYWSRLFNIVEAKALKNSRFEDFRAELNDTDGITVSFGVYTVNFYEAARQMLVFHQLMSQGQSLEGQKTSPLVKSFKASDFKIDKNGEIFFKADILLNKNLLYERE